MRNSWVMVFVLMVGCGEAEKPTSGFTTVETLLWEGERTVDVMELGASKRVTELTLRMKKAAEAKPEWWLQYVAKAKSGQPLPYHPNLGITREEYDELEKAKNNFSMQKKTEAPLSITKIGKGVYRFDGGKELPELTGAEIDLEKDVARLSMGEADIKSEINAPEKTAFGAWKGVQWKYEKLDPSTFVGTRAVLAVGVLKKSGSGLLYYNVRRSGPKEIPQLTYGLLFDIGK